MAVLLTLACSTTAWSASAAIQTSSAAYGSQASPLGIGDSQILSLDKFDTSLGTLTSATLYQGLGSQSFDVTVALSPGVYSGVSTGPVFFGGQGSAYGTVEIEYNYSPVPEPETLLSGLVLTGFAGLGLFRNRRLAKA